MMLSTARPSVLSVSLLPLLVAVAIVLTPASVVANHNHFLSYNAVVRGNIYYVNRMDKFRNALNHADSKWSSSQRVDIRPTPNGHRTTLEFKTSRGRNVCGVYNPDESPDLIEVSIPLIDEGNCGSGPRWTLTHELGHALAIYDHRTSEYLFDLMYVSAQRCNNTACYFPPTVPQGHDWHDYQTYWGRPPTLVGRERDEPNPGRGR